MQRTGEHHAPTLQTPLETEHYVTRNKKNSIKETNGNQAEGRLRVFSWEEQKIKIQNMSKVKIVLIPNHMTQL